MELKVKVKLTELEPDATVDEHSLCSALQDEFMTDTVYIDVMNEETGDDEETETSIELEVVPLSS